jgi:ornithine cyclodeaminase/alanine dehydrogenase-like protein (mu-crystallin family)
MALLIKGDAIWKILTMKACVKSCREAYRVLGRGEAINRPRSLVHVSLGDPGLYYLMKSMEGILPAAGVAAVRITSQLAHWFKAGGNLRKEKSNAVENGYLVGMVLLFDTESGKLLSIMPDAVLDWFRLGATNALAADYLARRDAQVLALLGTGNHARTQTLGFIAVRDLRLIKVFSPNPEHRYQFCTEMARGINIEIRAVDTPDEAVSGADIVAAATNSRQPVLMERWVRDGVHYSTILSYEAEPGLVKKADIVAVNLRDARGDIYSLPNDEVLSYYGGGMAPDYRAFSELAELVVGSAPLRLRQQDKTLFINNLGAGIQFAAVANVVYRKARENKIGEEVSDDFFCYEVA